MVFGFKIEIKKHRKITQSIFTFQKGGKKETWKDDPMTGWLENFLVTIRCLDFVSGLELATLSFEKKKAPMIFGGFEFAR